jgi:hypothetical protein
MDYFFRAEKLFSHLRRSSCSLLLCRIGFILLLLDCQNLSREGFWGFVCFLVQFLAKNCCLKLQFLLRRFEEVRQDLLFRWSHLLPVLFVCLWHILGWLRGRTLRLRLGQLKSLRRLCSLGLWYTQLLCRWSWLFGFLRRFTAMRGVVIPCLVGVFRRVAWFFYDVAQCCYAQKVVGDFLS